MVAIIAIKSLGLSSSTRAGGQDLGGASSGMLTAYAVTLPLPRRGQTDGVEEAYRLAQVHI